MQNIVVGVDRSESAARALAWAVREGRLHGRTVTAVLAWDLLNQHHIAADEPFSGTYREADASAALDSYVVNALAPEAASEVRRQVICDRAAPALLAAAADAWLLVVGARGLGGFRGLLLGSVSQHCLHHAPCPLAIIRDDGAQSAKHEPERVVVGIDGSGTAGRALHWALEEAQARMASIDVVHAWHEPFPAGYPHAGTSFDTRIFEDEARRVLDRAIDRETTARGIVRPVERVVVNSGAASAILETSKGADLVVVGSRGLGGFSGMLLGSVSQHVAHHASCPVVVVPPYLEL
jgi:nucleotide-binding universal stress UspA family protein